MSWLDVVHLLVALAGCALCILATWYCFWAGVGQRLGALSLLVLWVLIAVILPFLMFAVADRVLYFSKFISTWRMILWLASWMCVGFWASYKRNRRH